LLINHISIHIIVHTSYVRVKRQQQTFCFLCNPEKETVGTLKQRIYTILTQQHPMKDVDIHIHSVSDLRIVSSVTAKSEQQQQLPLLVLLDTDTLEYVQQKQTEQKKNSSSEDPNKPSNTANDDNNSDHGMVLYLLLPIVSGNDDANTTEEWETIQVVSTDI
jgi:hypothetical protein